MHGLWPWLAMAGLGAFHGLNPAMGWLFAVGLGLQDRSRRSVLRALPPIAIGHEASLLLVAGLVLGLGLLGHPTALHIGAAAALIAFGVFRFARPRAHPRWTKMRVGPRELTLWSFLMSSAHGAGLMVAPVLIGAGVSEASADGGHAMTASDGSIALLPSALALVLHVGAMLAVMGVVSVLVYERLGVAILRKAWLNTEGVWAAAFVVAGLVTLFS
jgi:hypothetical protein